MVGISRAALKPSLHATGDQQYLWLLKHVSMINACEQQCRVSVVVKAVMEQLYSGRRLPLACEPCSCSCFAAGALLLLLAWESEIG
jgi:hypothetical protein